MQLLNCATIEEYEILVELLRSESFESIPIRF